MKAGTPIIVIVKAFEAKIPNLQCVMNKYTPQPSTGAFEITHKGIIIFSKK
jgi:hypothetical protein